MALDEATNPMQGVSGPSTYSKRTDLEYKSQSYGDGIAYNANKSAAQLSTAAKNPKLSEAPVVGTTQDSTPLIGLYDKTTRPEENIATFPTSSAPSGKLSDTLAILLPYDATGEITVLYQNALSRGQ